MLASFYRPADFLFIKYFGTTQWHIIVATIVRENYELIQLGVHSLALYTCQLPQVSRKYCMGRSG